MKRAGVRQHEKSPGLRTKQGAVPDLGLLKLVSRSKCERGIENRAHIFKVVTGRFEQPAKRDVSPHLTDTMSVVLDSDSDSCAMFHRNAKGVQLVTSCTHLMSSFISFLQTVTTYRDCP